MSECGMAGNGVEEVAGPEQMSEGEKAMFMLKYSEAFHDMLRALKEVKRCALSPRVANMIQRTIAKAEEAAG